MTDGRRKVRRLKRASGGWMQVGGRGGGQGGRVTAEDGAEIGEVKR